MNGAFISSWLRMMFSAATSAIRHLTVDRSNFANRSESSSTNGQRGGIAQAKRAALKAKRRKAHKARCR